ncbi:MAG: hypothetical protein ACKOYI_10545 [Actinomycetota bacterium]
MYKVELARNLATSLANSANVGFLGKLPHCADVKDGQIMNHPGWRVSIEVRNDWAAVRHGTEHGRVIFSHPTLEESHENINRSQTLRHFGIGKETEEAYVPCECLRDLLTYCEEVFIE